MKGTSKRKKIVTIVSLAVGLCLLLFLTWLIFVKFMEFGKTPQDFRRFVDGYGAYGWLVAAFIQIIQVVIALLPGEFVEIGLGYAYGPIVGTALCILGATIGSALVFKLTKIFGIKIVELFFDTDKINKLKIISTEKKLKRTVFILFFIPGTPKDLLTYFVGLTRLSMVEFLGISMIARLPSIITSTVGGGYLGQQNYIGAVITFVITGIISLIGIKIYNVIIAQKHRKKEK